MLCLEEYQGWFHLYTYEGLPNKIHTEVGEGDLKLSGGQRQRVAIGRAIVRDPEVFLFDEPLSNLDAALRVQTRLEIARLHERLGSTMIYVTHDQVEAMTMGDRVAVLKDGFLQQVDTPRNLYDNPANAFVAGFIGSPAMNLLNAPVSGGQAKLGGLSIAVPASAGATITVGIRPEGFTPSSTGFEVLVEVVEELGAYLSGNDILIDGGASEVGIESTIIDCSGVTPKILRPGIISKEQVEKVCGLQSGDNVSGSKVKASGLLISHYSPVAEVVLDGKTSPEDGFFALAEIETPTGAIRLGSPATIEEYYQELFPGKEEFDYKGVSWFSTKIQVPKEFKNKRIVYR